MYRTFRYAKLGHISNSLITKASRHTILGGKVYRYCSFFVAKVETYSDRATKICWEQIYMLKI